MLVVLYRLFIDSRDRVVDVPHCTYDIVKKDIFRDLQGRGFRYDHEPPAL